MLTKTTKRPLISELIKNRLINRRKKEALDASYERFAVPIEAEKHQLDSMIVEFLNESGAKSIKTAEGTASTKMLPNAKVADPEVLMNFVIEHKEFNLLKRAVNTYAIQDYVEKHSKVVPGVNFSRYQTVNVRRPDEPPLKEPTDE